MISINTHAAKTRLSELLAKIENQGEIVLICRNGKPVAEMRPLPKNRNPLGQDRRLSKVVFRADPTQPLDQDDWPSAIR